MRGSLQTIRDGVQRAQRDLASPNYRDIDARYRKQLIELKTTEMANSDLDKYHKVGLTDLPPPPSWWTIIITGYVAVVLIEQLSIQDKHVV